MKDMQKVYGVFPTEGHADDYLALFRDKEHADAFAETLNSDEDFGCEVVVIECFYKKPKLKVDVSWLKELVGAPRAGS